MTKIPESCYPVNARAQFELASLEAEKPLRHMHKELEHMHIGPLALRTLNQRSIS